MRERLGREYFEELYEKSSDPWNFETSEYEREKYLRTLRSLGDRRFRRALEAGCSIGVFTEMLAPRCGELLAVDASERAVAAARERLEKTTHVRVERRMLPEDIPGGTFDLIVASEVLYYLDRETMLEALRLLENALDPGGLLLAVHWRKETKTYPLLGDEVHDLLRSHTRLRHAKSETEPEYLLDLFERKPGVGEGAEETFAAEPPAQTRRAEAKPDTERA
jgi:predicted TPR repeat methyltransferase